MNPSSAAAGEQPLSGSSSHRNPKSTEPPAPTFGSTTEVNTILLYNIAAMSYQMQQYGQALSYLIELLKKSDQAEDFIALKGLFLLL